MNYIQNIPNFPKKCFLFSIFRMDMRFFYNPDFDNPFELNKILSHSLSFDLETIELAWNAALSDSGYEENPVAKKVVLSPKEERTLFLQYNYARYVISGIMKIAAMKCFSIREANMAAKWGETLKRCRDTLIVSNLALVFSMGRQYNIFQNSDSSELFPEGFRAIMRAVDRFDVSKNFKFSTYSCKAIIQGMNRCKSKTAARLKNEFSSSLDITPESKIINLAEPEMVRDIKIVLEENTAKLSDIEMQVIQCRYFQAEKLHEVSDRLKLTKERVRQIQNKAIEKLRGVMVA